MAVPTSQDLLFQTSSPSLWSAKRKEEEAVFLRERLALLDKLDEVVIVSFGEAFGKIELPLS
jgi:hypothetical protein